MRTIDRIVSLFTGLLLIVLACVFFGQSIGRGYPLDGIVYYLGGPLGRTLTTLVLIVLAAYLLWMALRRRRQEKTILCDTPLGEVRIAERAVQGLALRAARKVKGVQDAIINVRATISGLEIYVETMVGPDQSIPQITQEIRTRVAEYIRETVGISVNTVAVLVSRIAPETRARVE